MSLKTRIRRLEARRPGGPLVHLTTNAALRAAGMWLLREGAYGYFAAVAGIDGGIPDPLPDGCRLISDAEALALIAAGRCPVPVEFADVIRADA